MIELSIIIPVYNCELFINRCVDSILVQIPLQVEIILVNDGSNDKSGEICDYYESTCSIVHVIHQANKGVSAARNAGLISANGKYVWFVDADDFIEPNSIQLLLNILKEQSLDLLQFGNNIVFEDNSFKYLRRCKESKVLLPNDYLQGGYFNGTAWQSIFLKSIVESGTLLDEDVKLGQDGLFFVRILAHSQRVKRISFRAYNYFQNTDSKTYNISFGEALLVAKKVTLTKLPDYAKNFVVGFSDFYLALSLLAPDYNEDDLLRYIKENSVVADEVLIKKVVQQLISYRYGMVRIKSKRSERIIVLKRVKLFINRLELVGKVPKAIRLFFNFTNINIIDLFFSILVNILKPIYFRLNKQT